MDDKKQDKMLDALRKHLESLTEEEKEELRKKLCGPELPEGWISIDEHLPMMLAKDIVKGYSEYRVKDKDGNEFMSWVSDHNIWKYRAIEAGITHWYNSKIE